MAMVVMAMRILRRGLMGMVIMCSGRVAVIVVTMVAVSRGRGVIVVCGVAVIIMTGRSRGGMIVVSMIGMGRRVIIMAVSCGGRGMVVMTMVGVGGSVVLVDRGGRMGGVVIVTVARIVAMSGFGTVTRAMTVVGGVIVVRLVLVAHCDSVPQPLFAVFTAKSV